MKFPIRKILNFADGRLLTCIDDVYAIRSGGNLILSSVKHYFSEYSNMR